MTLVIMLFPLSAFPTSFLKQSSGYTAKPSELCQIHQSVQFVSRMCLESCHASLYQFSQAFWKWLRILVFCWYNVQMSQAYKSLGDITVLYTLNFFMSDLTIIWLAKCHTRFGNPGMEFIINLHSSTMVSKFIYHWQGKNHEKKKKKKKKLECAGS